MHLKSGQNRDESKLAIMLGKASRHVISNMTRAENYENSDKRQQEMQHSGGMWEIQGRELMRRIALDFILFGKAV